MKRPRTDPVAVEAALSSHPFLKGVEERYLARVASCTSPRTFDRGEYLERQGSPAEMLHLVQKGQVSLQISVPNQGALRVETITAGEVLGWYWLVPPFRWSLDAYAITPVDTLAVKTACLHAICEEDHAFGREVLQRCARATAERLQAAHLRLVELQSA